MIEVLCICDFGNRRFCCKVDCAMNNIKTVSVLRSVVLFSFGLAVGLFAANRICSCFKNREDDCDSDYLDELDDCYCNNDFYSGNIDDYFDRVMDYTERAYLFLREDTNMNISLKDIHHIVMDMFCESINNNINPTKISFDDVIGRIRTRCFDM